MENHVLFLFFVFYESDEFLFHAPDPAVIFICFFHKDLCPAWETALTLWLKLVISRAFVVFVMFAEIQDTFIQCRSRCQFRVGLQSVLNGSLMENSWVNQINCLIKLVCFFFKKVSLVLVWCFLSVLTCCYVVAKIQACCYVVAKIQASCFFS